MLSDDDINRIAVALADEMQRRGLFGNRSGLEAYQRPPTQIVTHYHHCVPQLAPAGTLGDFQCAWGR